MNNNPPPPPLPPLPSSLVKTLEMHKADGSERGENDRHGDGGRCSSRGAEAIESGNTSIDAHPSYSKYPGTGSGRGSSQVFEKEKKTSDGSMVDSGNRLAGRDNRKVIGRDKSFYERKGGRIGSDDRGFYSGNFSRYGRVSGGDSRNNDADGISKFRDQSPKKQNDRGDASKFIRRWSSGERRMGSRRDSNVSYDNGRKSHESDEFGSDSRDRGYATGYRKSRERFTEHDGALPCKHSRDDDCYNSAADRGSDGLKQRDMSAFPRSYRSSFSRGSEDHAHSGRGAIDDSDSRSFRSNSCSQSFRSLAYDRDQEAGKFSRSRENENRLRSSFSLKRSNSESSRTTKNLSSFKSELQNHELEFQASKNDKTSRYNTEKEESENVINDERDSLDVDKESTCTSTSRPQSLIEGQEYRQRATRLSAVELMLGGVSPISSPGRTKNDKSPKEDLSKAIAGIGNVKLKLAWGSGLRLPRTKKASVVNSMDTRSTEIKQEKCVTVIGKQLNSKQLHPQDVDKQEKDDTQMVESVVVDTTSTDSKLSKRKKQGLDHYSTEAASRLGKGSPLKKKKRSVNESPASPVSVPLNDSKASSPPLLEMEKKAKDTSIRRSRSGSFKRCDLGADDCRKVWKDMEWSEVSGEVFSTPNARAPDSDDSSGVYHNSHKLKYRVKNECKEISESAKTLSSSREISSNQSKTLSGKASEISMESPGGKMLDSSLEASPLLKTIDETRTRGIVEVDADVTRSDSPSSPGENSTAIGSVCGMSDDKVDSASTEASDSGDEYEFPPADKVDSALSAALEQLKHAKGELAFLMLEREKIKNERYSPSVVKDASNCKSELGRNVKVLLEENDARARRSKALLNGWKDQSCYTSITEAPCWKANIILFKHRHGMIKARIAAEMRAYYVYCDNLTLEFVKRYQEWSKRPTRLPKLSSFRRNKLKGEVEKQEISPGFSHVEDSDSSNRNAIRGLLVGQEVSTKRTRIPRADSRSSARGGAYELMSGGNSELRHSSMDFSREESYERSHLLNAALIPDMIVNKERRKLVFPALSQCRLTTDGAVSLCQGEARLDLCSDLAAKRVLKTRADVKVPGGSQEDWSESSSVSWRQTLTGVNQPSVIGCNCAVALQVSEKCVNPWSDVERYIFLDKFLQYPKDFRKIASFLRNKNVRDCIRFYYDSKKSKSGFSYRDLLREQHKQRKVQKRPQWSLTESGTEGLGMVINSRVVREVKQQLSDAEVASNETPAVNVCDADTDHDRGAQQDFNAVDKNDFLASDNGPGLSGKVKKSKGKKGKLEEEDEREGHLQIAINPPLGLLLGDNTFSGSRIYDSVRAVEAVHSTDRLQMKQDLIDNTQDTHGESKNLFAKWSNSEKAAMIRLLKRHGKNWKKINEEIPSKSIAQIENYFQNYKLRLGLQGIVDEHNQRVSNSDQAAAAVNPVIAPTRYNENVPGDSDSGVRDGDEFTRIVREHAVAAEQAILKNDLDALGSVLKSLHIKVQDTSMSDDHRLAFRQLSHSIMQLYENQSAVWKYSKVQSPMTTLNGNSYPAVCEQPQQSLQRQSQRLHDEYQHLLRQYQLWSEKAKTESTPATLSVLLSHVLGLLELQKQQHELQSQQLFIVHSKQMTDLRWTLGSTQLGEAEAGRILLEQQTQVRKLRKMQEEEKGQLVAHRRLIEEHLKARLEVASTYPTVWESDSNSQINAKRISSEGSGALRFVSNNPEPACSNLMNSSKASVQTDQALTKDKLIYLAELCKLGQISDSQLRKYLSLEQLGSTQSRFNQSTVENPADDGRLQQASSSSFLIDSDHAQRVRDQGNFTAEQLQRIVHEQLRNSQSNVSVDTISPSTPSTLKEVEDSTDCREQKLSPAQEMQKLVEYMNSRKLPQTAAGNAMETTSNDALLSETSKATDSQKEATNSAAKEGKGLTTQQMQQIIALQSGATQAQLELLRSHMAIIARDQTRPK